MILFMFDLIVFLDFKKLIVFDLVLILSNKHGKQLN